jgi:hypothetical protein
VFDGVPFLATTGLVAAIAVPLVRKRLHVPARDATGWALLRWMWSGVLGILIAGSALVAISTLPNYFRSDDFDGYSGEQRRLMRLATDHSAGCFGYSHITDVRLTNDDDPRHGFTFRCEATIFGRPSFTGEAHCVDGNWWLPGWREPNSSVPCD